MYQSTPLHEAGRRGNVDMMRCLVDRGVDINIKGENRVSDEIILLIADVLV